jgi:hypothetical protein
MQRFRTNRLNLSADMQAHRWHRAQVGVVTVHQLEASSSQPRRATLQAIRRVFEMAGVQFIDENGGGP